MEPAQQTPPDHSQPAKDNGRGIPRYQWLHQILLNDIVSGKYPVGGLLPTEAQLCAEFGVSRHTVREATRKLVDAGMIVRYPSIGTIVKAAQPQAPAVEPTYVAGLANLQDIFAYTAQTRLEVFDKSIVAAADASSAVVRQEQGSRWIRLKANRILIETDRVISYSLVFLRPEFDGITRRLEGNHPSFYQMLKEDYEQIVHRVQQQVEATLMPEDALRQLGVAPGSPALLMQRAYYDDAQRLIVVSKNFYIADRLKLQSEWTPGEKA